MSITTYAEDMKTVYVRINWQNQPSTTTALGATNLNKIDLALSIVDGRVVTLNTTKLDQATANTMVQDIDLDANGVFTIKKLDGTTKTYDTKLEKLAVNFEYDSTTQRLVITLDDGTKQYVDMSALITEFEFLDSSTIAFSKNSAGKMSADVKNGSITEAKIQPNYLADIKVQAQNASNSANSALQSKNQAQSYAIGGMIAGDTTNNAKYFMEQARIARDEAEDISNVGVAGKDKLGLVKGNGNVEVRTTGDMWADPYKDKATALKGTFITCPTADDGLLHVKEMSGETVQKVTVEGKNKFDIGKYKNYNNSTVVNGVVTIDNTASNSDATLRRTEFNVITVTSGVAHTISIKNVNIISGTIGNVRVRFFDGANNTGTERYMTLNSANGYKATFTPTGNNVYLAFYLNVEENDKISFDSIQLEHGSTANQYEPFTPNSPSSEYPSSLLYAKEFDAMTCSDNLLPDEHQQSKTVSGVTFIRNSDGSITCNGTATANADYYIFGNYSIVRPYNFTIYANTDYTLNATGNSNVDILMVFGDDMANRNSFQTSTNNLVKRFTYDIRVFCGILRVKNGSTVNNVTVYPQLTKGNVALPYIKYKGDQKSISFPFMSLPNGVKNGKEYINGVYSDALRIKEDIFNGNEEWDIAEITSSYIRFRRIGMTNVKKDNANDSGNILCDKFKSYSQNAIGSSSIINGISTHTTFGVQIKIDINVLPSPNVAGLKLWLSQNPIKVQYELETPIINPTDEIYLETNKGTTNLFTNSYPQVEMTADFKSELWSRDYLQDMNDVRLDNKLNEINGYFTKYTTFPLSVSSQSELDNAINNVSTVDRQWYRLAVHINVENLTLHGGVWYIEGFRHSSGYEWQDASTYYVGGSAKRTRAKINNVWTAWSNILTSNDLVQSDTVSDVNKPPSSVVTEALGKEIDTLNNNLVKYKYIAGMAVNSIANQHASVYDIASDVELAGKNVLGVIPSIVAGWTNGEYIFSLYYNIETKKVMLTASITQTYTVSFIVLYI